MHNPTDEYAVEVQDLIARYGKHVVLKEISLHVESGEIFVIMGGSGSGKSTLLRYLLGLERPAAGCIRILGKELNQLSEMELGELRRKIGVAFQGGALFSSLSVSENLKLPLREHTALDERTMDIMVRLKLELVDLAGFADRMPAELSGGMLKRTALARAIVMDPKLLFCDEPSAGLDPVVAAGIDDLILKLREAAGMTVVVVTHELESAFKIADRVAVLDGGKILFIGTLAELRAHPHPRIQALLHRRPVMSTSDPDEYLRRLTGGVS